MRRSVVGQLRLLQRRARREAGFGMVELVCAMGVMAIGILAVYAMFQSGIVQIRRASNVTTAAALADTEMENYRAAKYDTLGLATTDVTAADSTYKGDGAYKAVSSPVNAVNSTVVVAKCPATPCTNSVPTKTVTGADGRGYRIDTYMSWETVQNQSGTAGRNVKRITIVVRDTAKSYTYARVASAFDQSTGQ